MKIRKEYKYIIFKITDDKKFIVIEDKGAKDATFADFTSKLPDASCRYAVLDVDIETKSGATANKLIFVAWSDDNASIKPKMLYASSKDALKKTLTGINEEYQVNAKLMKSPLVHLSALLERRLDARAMVAGDGKRRPGRV